MEIVKDAIIPFKIDDLEAIGNIDNNVYLVNYEKSELKGTNFIDYICVISRICDITNYENIATETKFEMIDRLYGQPEFVSVAAINRALINILLTYKGISNLDFSESFLTEKEVSEYIESHKEKIEKYVSFFDSLFVFMVVLGRMIVKNQNMDIKVEDLDKEFSAIELDDCSGIQPNICTLLFDSTFYDYYMVDIDTSKVKYFRKFYTEKLFMGKTILSIIMNDANQTFMKIIEMFENVSKS